MIRFLLFALSAGIFILLPNALADGGGLSIKTPLQVQAENNQVILMTLKVNNIQVRAEWRVNSASGAFSIDAQSGVLSVRADKQQTLIATVFVEDQFNLLNSQYTNLTASAVLTVAILSLSLPNARLYADAGNGINLHTFAARGGTGTKTYTVIAGNADYFTLDPASGVLSLHANATVGIYTLLVKVIDEINDDATALAIVDIVEIPPPLLLADAPPLSANLVGGVNLHTFIASGGIGAKTFAIVAGNEAGYFIIDAVSGILSAQSGALMLGIYPLLVEVSDSVSPPHKATAAATVNISELLDFTATYYSSPEIEAQMRALAEIYPQYASFTVIGESIEGRNIAALKITDTNVAAEEKVQAVMFGGYHAREWIAYNFVHMLGEYLITAAFANESKTLTAEGLTYDLSPRKLLAGAEVWVVPAVNPDGREYTKIDRNWRKNRRDNDNGTFGVDLNRNHSYKWGELGYGGSSGSSSSDTYRGVAANSEPETQAVCRLMYSLPLPNMVISYHSFGQLILYPWGWGTEGRPPGYKNLEDLNPPEYEYINGIAVTMAAFIKNVHGEDYRAAESGAGLYAANGNSQDWIYAVFEIPSYTFELRPTGHPHYFQLPEDQIWPTFQENLPAALYSIERAIVNKDRAYVGKSVEAMRGISECSPDYKL